MLIVLIVKKSLKTCFNDVKTVMAGAGLLGVMVTFFLFRSWLSKTHQHRKGNKGGTAIRFSFTPPNLTKPKSNNHSPGSTTFTFVNSHLAAFDEMVDKRNSDFHDLSKRLTFENSLNNHKEDLNEAGEQTVGLNPPLSVYEGDVVFWMVCRFGTEWKFESEPTFRGVRLDNQKLCSTTNLLTLLI